MTSEHPVFFFFFFFCAFFGLNKSKQELMTKIKRDVQEIKTDVHMSLSFKI